MTPTYGLQLVTGPTAEPVPLALAKAHLRVDHSDDDGLLAGYVLAARAYVEQITGRALLTQTWRMTLDRFPDGAFELARAPAVSIASVTYVDFTGQTQTVSPSSYALDATSLPPRLAPLVGWPAAAERPGAVTVQFTAGGDLASVPEPLRHAILLLVGHWYEHREAVTAGQTPTTVPLAFDALVAAYRVHWL